MDMNVLITGASGYIGRRFLHLLSERSIPVDHDIVLLTTRAIPGWSCVIVDRDIDGNYTFDRATTARLRDAGFDCVMHLGAFTPKFGADANRIGPSSSSIVNLQALMEAVDTPGRFVFASTIDVYGTLGSPFSEEAVPNPASLYGAAKLYSERMLQAWATERGVGMSILRIGHIYGPGEEAYRKFIPESIRRIATGQAPRITSSGQERRSFYYVDDLCDFLIRLLVGGESVGIVNMASAATHMVRDVAAMLIDIARDSGIAVPDPVIEGRFEAPDIVIDAGRLHAIHSRRETPIEVGLRTEFLSMIDQGR